MSKSEFTSIPNRLKTLIDLHFSKAPFLVMGVSGGPDSMALLYVLHKIGAQVFVVHINYGLRGEASDADQELVEGMASAWGFECCSVRLDPKQVDGNFQNWARNERYRIFRDFKRELEADAILTAHHQDDQIETIFQRILRGSGPAAWAGMQEWDGDLFRPLLTFTKQEILKFCEDEAIPFREDASNSEAKYARNFLRNEVLPQFDDYFPGWKKNILELPDRAEIISEAVDFVLKQGSREEGLDFEAFTELSTPLKVAVLKRFIESHWSFKLSKAELTTLPVIEGLQVGASLEIRPGTHLFRDRELILLRTNEPSEFVEITLNKEDLDSPTILFQRTFEKQGPALKKGSLQLDFDRLRWPLTIRRWQNGDVFQPLGMQGSQKVSDHLTNRKVPASKKKESLILKGADGTIYALFCHDTEPGSISELAKVTETTRHTLTITQ
jgi:tRNA(Ile)-lysidine synthase